MHVYRSAVWNRNETTSLEIHVPSSILLHFNFVTDIHFTYNLDTRNMKISKRDELLFQQITLLSSGTNYFYIISLKWSSGGDVHVSASCWIVRRVFAGLKFGFFVLKLNQNCLWLLSRPLWSKRFHVWNVKGNPWLNNSASLPTESAFFKPLNL